MYGLALLIGVLSQWNALVMEQINLPIYTIMVWRTILANNY